MNVCFEFLSEEPLDNTITCLNYCFDRVIYFGAQENIRKEKNSIDCFLKKYCDVKETEFIDFPSDDLQEIIRQMDAIIVREIEDTNKIYFDVTGGEGLILVAFGILSERYDTPMHKFNIVTNECIDLQDGSDRHITKDIPARRVELTIDKYVEMRGGTVNYLMHKEHKNPDSEDFDENVETLWKISRKHAEKWNQFTDFLSKNFHPDDDLCVCESSDAITFALEGASKKLTSVPGFHNILNELIQAGIITDYSRENNCYRFRIRNNFFKQCLWECGSILELYLYRILNNQSDYCSVGVHLDWDGIIHDTPKSDVTNEIDVLYLNGNIPTFVSCKMGNVDKDALYELDSVTKRFGGKYARKTLAVMHDLPDVDQLRADEMNITVLKVSEI